MSSSTFPTSAVDLLTELPGHPAGWTKANADRYAADLMDPLRELVDELGDRLRADVSDGIVSEPTVRGSISPINTDQRFAGPDAPPYKDHVLLRFWDGAKKQTAPTLFVRLGADGIGLASGVPLSGGLRDRWRTAVAAESGVELAAILDSLAADGCEVAGDLLAKVPKPHDADHPRAELLRRTGGLQVRRLHELPAVEGVAAFADASAKLLGEFADLHRWLVTHVEESS